MASITKVVLGGATLLDCVFGTNLDYGFYDNLQTDAAHRIVGCSFLEHKVGGIYLNSHDTVIVGCWFSDNTSYHVFLDSGSANNVIVGNTLRKGGTPGTDTAFNVYGNDNLIGMNFIEKMGGMDVIFQSTASRNKFWLNKISDSAVISDSGPNTSRLLGYDTGKMSMEGIVGGAVQQLMQANTTVGHGDTALLLLRNINSVYSLVRVSMDGPNTAGTGFRRLRVPN